MATYWVEVGHGGTDSGTETNPWLLLASAFAAVAAGDHVWVKGGTVYPEAIVPTTSGTSAAPITYEGYTTTTGDGGKFTLYNNASLTSGISGFAIAYCVFKNMIIDNYTSHGVLTTADYIQFNNCEFTNNGGNGVNCDNYTVFIDCKFNYNSNKGVDPDIDAVFVGCEFIGNTVHGISADNNIVTAYSCLFSGNLVRAIVGHARVFNCTIDGENVSGSIGIWFDSIQSLAVNCIIYDCQYGLSKSALTYQANTIGLNNLINSCTTPYSNWPTLAQASDITDPPDFTDEAGGDYTLASTSAARNAGADASGTSSPGMDIGAHQSEDAGGGAARVIITG